MRREHGQAAALTVLFLTVLLASAAAVIDVGSWFREDRDTQRVADAAALAGAQALPESQGTARALAIEFGGKNGGGVAAANVSFSTTVLAGDTINVNVEKPADSFFAKIVGIDSVEVGSTAKARAGVPSEARWAAPIAVDEKHPLLNCHPMLSCFGAGNPTELDLKKTGPGAFRLLNLDGSHGGTGPSTLDDWILRGLRRATCRSTGTTRTPARSSTRARSRRAHQRGSATSCSSRSTARTTEQRRQLRVRGHWLGRLRHDRLTTPAEARARSTATSPA